MLLLLLHFAPKCELNKPPLTHRLLSGNFHSDAPSIPISPAASPCPILTPCAHHQHPLLCNTVSCCLRPMRSLPPLAHTTSPAAIHTAPRTCRLVKWWSDYRLLYTACGYQQLLALVILLAFAITCLAHGKINRPTAQDRPCLSAEAGSQGKGTQGCASNPAHIPTPATFCDRTSAVIFPLP